MADNQNGSILTTELPSPGMIHPPSWEHQNITKTIPKTEDPQHGDQLRLLQAFLFNKIQESMAWTYWDLIHVCFFWRKKRWVCVGVCVCVCVLIFHEDVIVHHAIGMYLDPH